LAGWFCARPRIVTRRRPTDVFLFRENQLSLLGYAKPIRLATMDKPHFWLAMKQDLNVDRSHLTRLNGFGAVGVAIRVVHLSVLY
jgi:hypothetical protein